jgi:chaperone required for assembly of F1-ATPase
LKTKADIATQLARLSTEGDGQAMRTEILCYAETDLLCYRVAKTEKLRSRQDALFDPVLALLSKEYGIAMQITDTVAPIPQPPESLAALHTLLKAANNREMAALFALTPLLGSALLAIALWKRHITAEEAIAASQLDEAVAAEQWGEDEAEKTARENKAKDIRQCVIFLDA